MARAAKRFETFCKVKDIDKKLGLVFGWAMITKEDGQPYFDSQGDSIPDETMLKRSAEFMLSKRVAGEMHEVEDGDVIFAFPLTEELAKKLDIVSKRYGLLYGVKPSAEVFAKFESGEYTGFSIGGERLDEEVVEA